MGKKRGAKVTVSGMPQTRSTSTVSYAGGAMLLARRAEAIEALPTLDDLALIERNALVVAAVMHACAAIESDLNEVLEHGVGQHLGSNGVDDSAREFIRPIANVIDRTPNPLERWNLLLYLLRKPALEKGKQPYQDADLLVSIRNELVHFRSEFPSEYSGRRKSILERLENKGWQPFPEWKYKHIRLSFPGIAMSARAAHWAAETAVRFLDHVYEHLGVVGVLDGHRAPGATFQSILPPKHKSRR